MLTRSKAAAIHEEEESLPAFVELRRKEKSASVSRNSWQVWTYEGGIIRLIDGSSLIDVTSSYHNGGLCDTSRVAPPTRLSRRALETDETYIHMECY